MTERDGRCQSVQMRDRRVRRRGEPAGESFSSRPAVSGWRSALLGLSSGEALALPVFMTEGEQSGGEAGIRFPRPTA